MLSLGLILIGIVLPGWCLTRRLLPKASLLEEAIVGVGLGFAVIPTLAFAYVWLFQRPITVVVLLVLAAGITMATIPWRFPAAGTRDKAQAYVLAGLAVAGIALLQVTEIRATDSLELFEPCLHQSALYLQQNDSTGWTLYDVDQQRHVTHLLRHPTEPGFGLSTMLHYQRPLNAGCFNVFVTLGGLAGVELLALLVFFLVGGAATLAALNVTKRLATSVLAGLATVAALHGLTAYMINESSFVLATGMLSLALATRKRRGAGVWLAIGLLVGFGFGGRLTAALWLLPLGWLAWRETGRATAMAALMGGTVLFAFPWVWTFYSLMGDATFYPIPPQSETAHTVLGMTFVFRPLNWPFIDTLVRNSAHPVPPLFWVPLKCLQSAGSLLAGAAMVGGWRLWRDQRVLVGPVLAWILPVPVLLMTLAYLDYEKLSWILVAAPPLALAMGCFARAILDVATRQKTLISWAIVTVVLLLMPPLLTAADWPIDRRRYRRVRPDVEPPPQTVVQQKEALRLPTIFPSFHTVAHPSHLWTQLTAPSPEAFASGAIVAWQAHEDPFDVRFPVNATDAPPQVPDLVAVDTFEQAEIHEGTFLIAVQVSVSAQPTVHLYEDRHQFTVTIDPGPAPHSARYVAFVVKDYVSERFAGITVTVNQKPVPLTLSGYRVKRPDDEEPVVDLKLVSNYPALQAPEPVFVRRFADEERHYQWWSRSQ